MTGRETVRKAFAHKEGKIPLDVGAASTTGMHITCVEALRNYYGLEKHPVKVWEPCQMLGEIEDDLRDALGVDTVGVAPLYNMYGFKNSDYKEWKTPWGQEVLVPRDFNVQNEPAGNGILIYPEGDITAPASGHLPDGGYFFDTIIRQEDYDEDELDELDPVENLEEFGLFAEEILDHYEESVKNAAAGGRSVTLTMAGAALGDIALVPAPFLKYPKGIRDVEEWYVSTAIRDDYVYDVFEKQTDFSLENIKKVFERVGNTVDTVFLCGTDFGTQNSTFCSPDKFRELWMPHYKRMTRWIHENTEWKVFKHSCGAIFPLIDGLLESGFDILNPVQISAEGMDPLQLKNIYGERAIFWGGGVDTQKTLPFGTPEDVRKEVIRNCEILGKDGGFVFNSVHNIQALTPVENLVAMFEALRDVNKNR